MSADTPIKVGDKVWMKDFYLPMIVEAIRPEKTTLGYVCLCRHVAYGTVVQDGDYVLDPPGILTPEEVEQLCGQLRHLPQVNSGRAGNYFWKEVR